ncbi:MAG: hypothetical protein QXG00_06035 [Candidatus Woesearchaeota archaeon]
MDKDIIVTDVETQKLPDEVEGGWKNIEGMGISSCVTYSYNKNVYKFWGSTTTEHKNLLEYLNGNIVVGFNTINFDTKLILGNSRILSEDGITRNKKYYFYNFDIFCEIWKQIYKTKNCIEALEKQKRDKNSHVKNVWNLDQISKNTLGNTCCKTENGKTAPEKFKLGLIKELFEYNLQDVRTEKNLYEFVLKYRYIVNGTFDIVRFEDEYITSISKNLD